MSVYFKGQKVSPTILIQKEKQEITINPTTNEQVLTPDEGKVFTLLKVNPVTASIDPNIESDNIKENITILGKVGSLQGLDDLSIIKYSDNMYQIETGRIPPTDEEYEQIIEKGYKILDYIFRGVTA